MVPKMSSTCLRFGVSPNKSSSSGCWAAGSYLGTGDFCLAPSVSSEAPDDFRSGFTVGVPNRSSSSTGGGLFATFFFFPGGVFEGGGVGSPNRSSSPNRSTVFFFCFGVVLFFFVAGVSLPIAGGSSPGRSAFFVAAAIGRVVSEGGEEANKSSNVDLELGAAAAGGVAREGGEKASDWLDSLVAATLRAREGGRRLPPGLARVWKSKVSVSYHTNTPTRVLYQYHWVLICLTFVILVSVSAFGGSSNVTAFSVCCGPGGAAPGCRAAGLMFNADCKKQKSHTKTSL